MSESLLIRAIEPSDVADILGLIRELAEYEHAPHEVVNTEAQLLADGFGEKPLYGGFVAVLDGKVVGMAIYYYRYSTWKGKVLYLEDIYVQPEYRRYQIGSKLLKTLVEFAAEQKCARVSWQVLDWNEPAINFYKKLNANFDPEWVNVYLTAEQFVGFLEDGKN
jgi:GNAT superfamily N-acetyltransferase